MGILRTIAVEQKFHFFVSFLANFESKEFLVLKFIA